MRKIPQSYSENLPPAKLYLDDIRKIVEVFRQHSKHVTVRNDEYEFDSWEDLGGLKEEFLTRLYIESEYPDIIIRISMGPSSISLHAREDNTISRGLLAQVKDIVLARKQPFARLSHMVLVPTSLVVISMAVLAATVQIQDVTLIVRALVVLAILSVWLCYSYHRRYHRFSIIVPKFRMDNPSFIKRNRDRIVMTVISAIILAVVAAVIGHFLK